MLHFDKLNSTLSSLETPALVLDLEQFEKNCDAVFAQCDLPVRIASKSIRCIPALTSLLQNRRSHGILSYSAREAFELCKALSCHILIAYPTVQWTDIERCLAYSDRVTFMVSDPEHLNILDQVAKKFGKTISYCIDIDQSLSLPGLHFGVRRSGVRTAKDVSSLVMSQLQNSSLNFYGFMSYDAQIAGVKDRDPSQWYQNGVIKILKKISFDRANKQRCEILNWCKDTGINVNIFNSGGTGSLHWFSNNTTHEKCPTEVTAGSGFFAPELFDHYENLTLKPALFMVSKISRNPQKNWWTMQGGGYIASGKTGFDRQPKIIWPQDCQTSPLEGFGEVQTPFFNNSSKVKIGDLVWMRHAKAGEPCEHFNKIYVVKDNSVIDEWKTYRGEGWVF